MNSQECVAVLQDHIADLRRTADVIDKECGEAFTATAAEIRKAADELEPLTAAIDALQRQGEAVARVELNGLSMSGLVWTPYGKSLDLRDGTKLYAPPPQPPTGEQTP